MAAGASLLLENVLPAPRTLIKGIRIRRGLQRVEIQRQRIELFIAITYLFWVCGLEIAVVRTYLKPASAATVGPKALVYDRVTHKIGDGPMPCEARGVEISDIFDAD